MITDKNEAFKHNSCKKLAQLAKVIFQMSSLSKDRQDELQSITIHYESTIAQLVKQHYALAEGISKDLVTFRKNCIDKACQDYGNAYKNIKTNYSNLCRSKLQKLSDIYDEMKKMLQFINDTKIKSINDSDSLSKHASRIQSEIANYDRQNKTTVKKKITAAIIPINEKISKLQNENEKKFKQMKNEHSQKVKIMKAKISQIYQNEIFQMKPTFTQIRNKFEALNGEVKALNSQFHEISNSYSDNFNNDRSKRYSILSTTKNQFNEKTAQISDLIKSEKIKKAERAAEINELQQILQNTMKMHQNELNDLINQINAQKHLRHQLMASRSAEMEKMRNNSNVRYQQLIQQSERSIKERKQWLQNTVEMINESNKNMEILKGNLAQQIESSVKSVKSEQNSFSQKLNNEIAKAKSIYESKLNEFKESTRKRLRLVELTLQKQDEINCDLQSMNSNEIHSLLADLKSLQTTINRELSEKSKKVTVDKENFQAKNVQIEKQKKEEISKKLEQKKALKDKEYKTLADKYSKDLESQKNERLKENQKKLEDYDKSIQNILNIENEEKQHSANISKMKAKLQVATNNVKKAEDEKEKCLNVLQNKLQNCEKENRQCQRRIEKEISTMNEEYEMKIQVEQVRLNNAIENLAKLYDKDENQRGVELIDMIRKLREMHNRTDDLLDRKKKEIEKENEDFEKNKSNALTQIDELKIKKLQDDLLVKYDDNQRESKASLKKIEIEFSDKINVINEQIEKMKSANFSRLQKVKQDMAKEEADFQLKVADFQAKKQEISKSASESMNSIQNDFDAKFKESKAQHLLSVNKLKQRIESAKSNQISVVSDTSKEVKKAQTNDTDQIHRKCNEDISNIESNSKTFIGKDHKLADEMSALASKFADLSVKLENPPQMRNSEVVFLNEAKQKLDSEDASLLKMFDDLYVKIDKMAKNPKFIIAPDSLNIKSASNGNFNSDDITSFHDSSSSSSSVAPPCASARQVVHVKEPSEPFSSRQNARRNSKSARMGPRRGSMPLKNIRTLCEPQVV